jgi:chromosome segregation ATPase
MNNTMTELDQEIADLKSDIADLQKENARLERELQDAYDEKPAAAPEPKPVDIEEIGILKADINQLSSEKHNMSLLLTQEKAKTANAESDLMMALSLVEIIRMNGQDSWKYFTTTEGLQRLKWARGRYDKQMHDFLHTA